ncbi:hypothetical protein N7523_004030 [Penicillium sp. IBT 18751x]|nr:hypothetical protein N7523_004030 [Penicillium sp. IBT 18751x]
MPRLRTLKSVLEACRPYSTFPARARNLQPRSNPPLYTLQATWCFSMRGPESDPDFLERATKRRRLSTSPERGRSKKAMDQTHPAIHLTPIESTLRTLLLDVAQYIYEKDQENNAPDRSKTVLRFTGGWVRDKLLGIDSHDIDVGISNMTGYQFGNLLKEYLDQSTNLDKYRQALPDGQRDAIVSLHKIEANPEKSKHLETVTTKIFGMDIDLVNLRKETYTEDSRNPQMEFGTAVEDALRRDATINALFYNLNESRLEDLTERGLEDMKKRIIRTPMDPYQTFKDDPLRVLRLIRFASRLGYQIESGTETAMQNEDIGIALKLKISKERVWSELDKMLRGPDPRSALQFIDRLGLYPTIFANHQDDVLADTSTWSIGYNALARFLHSTEDGEEAQLETDRLRQILLRDATSTYYAWIIATFAPWCSVPKREGLDRKNRSFPERAVEVARESLRSDNKTLTLLRDGAAHYKDIIQWKSDLLANNIKGTPAEIRQKVGLQIRTWSKDWKLCVVLAMLQEVMQGRDFAEVIREYDQFLAYIIDQDLEGVCELKPVVNGGEIMKSLGAKNGPWMSKATTMVLEWQLLDPDTTPETVLAQLAERRAELGL